MIKQLLNSVFAKYRYFSDPLATDKSRYFAQPRPVIVELCNNFLKATCRADEKLSI